MADEHAVARAVLPNESHLLDDDDVDEELEEELLDLARPPRRAPAPERLSNPRLRQVNRPVVTVPTGDGGSWWTRPDADFAREQERLHAQNASSVDNLIGWGAVGTSTKVMKRW